MSLHQVAPTRVPDLGGARRGIADVREQERREHTLGLCRFPGACLPRSDEELLEEADGLALIQRPDDRVAGGQLDEPRSRDAGSDVAARLGASRRHRPSRLRELGAARWFEARHERRNPDAGQSIPDVDRETQLDEARERRRARAQPGVRLHQLCELIVADAAWDVLCDLLRVPLAATPPFGIGRSALGLRARSPRIIGRPPPAHDRVVEDESSGALGVRGREQDGQCGAVRGTEERSFLGTGGVHDRSHVVHSLLERGRAGHGIRDAGTALVEEQHAREGREGTVVVAPALELPAEVDVRQESRHHHQVERAFTEGLVPDEDVATSGVACLGNVHPKSLPRGNRHVSRAQDSQLGRDGHCLPRPCGGGSSAFSCPMDD